VFARQGWSAGSRGHLGKNHGSAPVRFNRYEEVA